MKCCWCTVPAAALAFAAVEMGKMLGATVIAAASSEDKLAVAQKRGADHLVLYGREPFRDAVKRITDVAAPMWCSIRSAARYSRTACAASPGARVSWWSVSPAHWARPHQSLADQGRERAWRPRRRGGAERSGVRRSASEGAVGVAEAGKIRPHVSHRLPLEDYAQAMRLLVDRKAIGRVR